MEIPSRPTVLGGVTVKVQTGCGNMYVVLNWREGRLWEVFATLGHGGGCAVAQSEAVTRSVTVGLKVGVPLDIYIKQFRNIRCPNPVLFDHAAALSCPDAVARTLERYGVMTMAQVVAVIQNGGVEVLSPEEEERAAVTEMERLATAREDQGL